MLSAWVLKVDFALLIGIYLFKMSTPSTPTLIPAQIQQHVTGRQNQQFVLNEPLKLLKHFGFPVGMRHSVYT